MELNTNFKLRQDFESIKNVCLETFNNKKEFEEKLELLYEQGLTHGQYTFNNLKELPLYKEFFSDTASSNPGEILGFYGTRGETPDRMCRKNA